MRQFSGQLVFAETLHPVCQPPIHGGGFLAWCTDTGEIEAVGPLGDLPESLRAQHAEAISQACQQHWLLTPGLINAHTHLDLTALEPMPHAPSMAAWLADVIAWRQANPLESRQALLAKTLAQLARYGTTAVNDVCAPSNEPVISNALQQAGLRAQLSLEFFGLNTAQFSEKFNPVLQQYQQLAPTPTRRYGLSPHALYNVQPGCWQHALQATQAIFSHVHLLEWAAESQWLSGEPNDGQPNDIDAMHRHVLGQTFRPDYPVAPTGSVLAMLDKLGFFEQNHEQHHEQYHVLFAHGVMLTEADYNWLEANPQASIGWVHCPQSNLLLHGNSLEAPLRLPLHALGLGTDSSLSAPSLDVRCDAVLAQQRLGWSADQALYALTLGGARAMGWEKLGALTPGYQADWVLWEPSKTGQPAWLSPQHEALRVVVAGQSVL